MFVCCVRVYNCIMAEMEARQDEDEMMREKPMHVVCADVDVGACI
jgi:hypothetical protein